MRHLCLPRRPGLANLAKHETEPLIANILSFIILVFFFWGRSLRFKNLRLHIQVMTLVIVADLLLVLGLVIHRRALEKVAMDMPWTLKIHVPIAVITVLLYFPTAWAGYQLYKGKNTRRMLRYLDRVLVPARVLTLLTSLMVAFIDA